MLFWKANKYKKMTTKQICENMSDLMLDKSFLKYFYNDIIKRQNDFDLWSKNTRLPGREQLIINSFENSLSELSDDDKKIVYKMYYKILPDIYFELFFLEFLNDPKVFKFYIKKLSAKSKILSERAFDIFNSQKSNVISDKKIIKMIRKCNKNVLPILDEKLSNYYYNSDFFMIEYKDFKLLNYKAILTSGILNHVSVVNKLLVDKNIIDKYELLFINWITHDVIKEPSLYFSSLNDKKDFKPSIIDKMVYDIKQNRINLFKGDVSSKLDIFIKYIKNEKGYEMSDFFIERLLEEFKFLSIHEMEMLISHYSNGSLIMKDILKDTSNYSFVQKLTSRSKYENLQSIKKFIKIINKCDPKKDILLYEKNIDLILYLLNTFEEPKSEYMEPLTIKEKYEILNSIIHKNDWNFYGLNIIFKNHYINICDTKFIEEKIKEYIKEIKSNHIKESDIIESCLYIAYCKEKIDKEFLVNSLKELVNDGYYTTDRLFYIKGQNQEKITELKAIHADIQSKIIGSEMKNNVEKKRNRL